MGLFRFKKEKTAAPKPEAIVSPEVTTVRKAPSGGSAVDTDIILNPRITEKATLVGETGNVYVFNVRTNATKPEVAKAVARIFKVHPVSVRVITVPAKQVFGRGRRGMTSAGKKAYVRLPAGEKIELV